jgi:hypothetical protein
MARSGDLTYLIGSDIAYFPDKSMLPTARSSLGGNVPAASMAATGICRLVAND